MILLCSVFLNFLFLYAVFDLHFQVIHFKTAPACERNLTRLTKRVVLAVSDGMTSERMYSDLAFRGRNSFFRRVMEDVGTWGFSNTSISSSSKSEFVSMITGAKSESSVFLNEIGLYPFEHDLVFNNTDHIFYSGDPYIGSYTPNMDKRRRWTFNTWPEGFEDSVKKDYYQFDNFAYEGINKSFFNNKTLRQKLKADKTIFILWSTSMDYCDLINEPKCSSVVENLDKNMENLDLAFRSYYGDNQTTFIFICGHGMTDSSASSYNFHSSCPFIAWGPGIRKGGGKTKDTPKHWKMKNMKSVNIEQIDIAGLITTLLGDPTPALSCGIVQKDVLDTDDKNIRDSLYCNQKQIYHLLKEHARKTGDYLVLENSPGGENVTDLMKKIGQSLKLELAEKLIRIQQKQLELYKRYFNLFLWKIVSLIYLGWGIFLLQRQFQQEKPQTKQSLNLQTRINRWYVKMSPRKNIFSYLLHFMALVFCISLFILAFLKNWPRHFLVYFAVLCLVWWRVFKNINFFTIVLDNVNSFRNTIFWMIATTIPLCAVISGICRVYSRQILVIITTIALFLTMKLKNSEIIIWILSSIIILLSFVYEISSHDGSLLLMKIGSLSWICFLILFIYYKNDSIWSFIYFFILIVSVWNAITIWYLPEEFKVGHSVLAWCILTVCFFLPHFSPKQGVEKLYHFCFSFGTSFILMGVGQEALGLLAFCLHLSTWFAAELRESKTDESVDIRRGFLLLFYVYTGYFSIGNTDYPNLFEIDWAYSLVTQCQPIVAALLFYKAMTPQFVLATTFAMMSGRKQKAFEWFLFLNNIVSLVFFFSTKGDGYHFEEISISLFRFLLSLFFPVFFAIIIPFLNLLTVCTTLITKWSPFLTTAKCGNRANRKAKGNRNDPATK